MRHAGALRVARALACAVALAHPPARAAEEAPGGAPVELAGTWHVLVHFRDATTAHADTERWEDRLWVFEPAGDRLRWTEFPIVVFEDESGRFERREGTGQYARVLHFWEPNVAQLANLRAGLAVNDRGSQSKTLRREGPGWSSSARASPTGAGVVTYQETWSVGLEGGLPVFRQRDVLGSEGAEGMEGLTELRTEAVRDGGALLVGRFARDGTRTGSFEMRRAGERKAVPKKKRPTAPGPVAPGAP